MAAKPRAKPSATDELARAAKADDPGALLVHALAAWNAHPAPELTAIVGRASAIAARERPAISGLDLAERHASWMAVEKQRDAADLDRLLATLVEGRCEQALERMAKLAARPRDPRFISQLVGYIEADPRQARGETSPVPFTSVPNRTFWVRLLALVSEHGDATLVPRLRVPATRTALTNFERWLAAKATALADELASRVAPPLTAESIAALAKLDAVLARAEAELKPTVDTSAALFASVWAAPDDDAPRLVLADFLAEAGDPSGEFITLQLARAAGTLDAAGKKREKELLKRHKKTWLGPIEPLIQPAFLRFERGFLVTCSLEPNAELEATLGTHPAWSTIREFLVHGFARTTAKKLAAMLGKHGATRVDNAAFTRGIE